MKKAKSQGHGTTMLNARTGKHKNIIPDSTSSAFFLETIFAFA